MDTANVMLEFVKPFTHKAWTLDQLRTYFGTLDKEVKCEIDWV